MTTQLKQLLFYAGFGFISCIFVFWVPFGNSDQPASQTASQEPIPHTGTVETTETTETLASPPELNEPIRIKMETHFLTRGMIEFLSGFEEKNKVKIQISDSFLTGESPDLILGENILETGEALKFSQDISPLFLSGLEQEIKDKQLLPIGIDPFMRYTHKNTQSSNDSTLREAYREAQSSNGSFYLPRLDSGEHASLKSNNLGIELLTKEHEYTNDIFGFEKMIDEMLIPESASKLINIYLQQKKCKDYPLSCLMEKRFIFVGFGFRSQIGENPDLNSDFFPSKLGKTYARLIARSIPSNSTKPERARTLLLAYLQLDEKQLTQISDENKLIPALVELNKDNSALNLSNLELLSTNSQILSKKQLLLLKKISEKKIKPDLYFERASVY